MRLTSWSISHFFLPSLFHTVSFSHRQRWRKKATNWSASQLHMNFPNCRLKLQHYVVPALVETALNMGNAGVTAVTQIHRSLTLNPSSLTSSSLPPYSHNDCRNYPDDCHNTKWQSTWRGAKPAAAESAAHIHHVVTEHLAPAFSAAGRFVDSESGKK